MADPLTLIGAGSALLGGLGSLFGSGQKQMPISPELRAVFDQLRRRSREGLSDETVNLLGQRLRTGLGNEFSGLSAVTEAGLRRRGAGIGVTQAALSRLRGQRQRALGAGITEIGLADEGAKFAALQQMSGLVPFFQQFENQGQGFADLFGAGLNLLINRPGKPETQRQNRGLGFDRVDPFGSDVRGLA